MLATLTATLVGVGPNKAALLEREVEFPFVPQAGLLLNHVHPDDDGYSLEVESVCWDYENEKLYLELGEVIVLEGAERSFEVTLDGWCGMGWTLDEMRDLGDALSGDSGAGDDAEGEDGVEEYDAGVEVNITRSTVHIYNGTNDVGFVAGGD